MKRCHVAGRTGLTITVTRDELACLQRAADEHGCSVDSLAGLFIYRGVMDAITGRFDLTDDMDDLRSLSLGTYR